MEAVRNNPSAALDLAMLQALDKILAGIKVHNDRAPLGSLARYGHYYPKDSPTAYHDTNRCKEPDGLTDATAPSSTGRPRPEHMVNATEPGGLGVMIRAGSGFGSSDFLPPNRHLTDDERGTSAKYPEVKGDGAKRPLLIVVVVPSDAPSDAGIDIAISPGP